MRSVRQFMREHSYERTHVCSLARAYVGLCANNYFLRAALGLRAVFGVRGFVDLAGVFLAAAFFAAGLVAFSAAAFSSAAAALESTPALVSASALVVFAEGFGWVAGLAVSADFFLVVFLATVFVDVAAAFLVVLGALAAGFGSTAALAADFWSPSALAAAFSSAAAWGLLVFLVEEGADFLASACSAVFFADASVLTACEALAATGSSAGLASDFFTDFSRSILVAFFATCLAISEASLSGLPSAAATTSRSFFSTLPVGLRGSASTRYQTRGIL